MACLLVAMAALAACGGESEQPSAAGDSTSTSGSEQTTMPTTVSSSPDLAPTTVVLGDPFEFATYWERGFADPRPVDMYLHTDDPSQPASYLLFGSVTNRGDEAVAGVKVHAEWLDGDGRVVWEADTDAELSGRAELAPGQAADWLFVVPPGDAPTLDGIQTRLSGVAT